MGMFETKMRQVGADLDRMFAELQADGDPTPPTPPPVEPPVTPPSVRLERYEGEEKYKFHNRTFPAGTVVIPTVIATDESGRGVGGVDVRFTAPGLDETVSTVSSGGAQIAYILPAGGATVVAKAGDSTARFEIKAEGSSGGGGSTPPVTPPPSGGYNTPPEPGPDSSSWTGDTIPMRIIEKPGKHPDPVAVTIIANGESRTFHRNSLRATRTINVPRGVDLTVVAHFEPTASAGVGGFGFSSLKLKAMNNAWGFTPSMITSENQSTWEPYTNNMAPGQPGMATPPTVPGWSWGGSLTTYCGSAPPGHPAPFWRYTISGDVTRRQGVDFLVCWLMDHQYPRTSCP